MNFLATWSCAHEGKSIELAWPHPTLVVDLHPPNEIAE